MGFRAVAIDIDGTLARADHHVSTRGAGTLTRLQARGVLPILITGRTETAALAIARAAGLTAPVISCNGALVTAPSTGARISEQHFPPPLVDAMVQFAQSHQLVASLWTPGRMFVTADGAVAQLLEAINSQPAQVVDAGGLPQQHVVKAMLGGASAQLDELASDLRADLPLMQRSLDHFYEASPAGAGKWQALRFVLDALAIDPHACLGIADGDTDVEWLTNVGQVVAPENARHAVRAIADQIIGHHDHDAVAEFLERRFDVAAS